KC
ncbi:hypothetical protein CFC21_022075, partial [Triticum aestivum]